MLASGVRTLVICVHGVKFGKRMSRTIGMRCKRCSPPFGIVLVVIDVMDKTMITVVVLYIDEVKCVMWQENMVELRWWPSSPSSVVRRS